MCSVPNQPAEVTIRVDLLILDLDRQNAFLADMDREGFGLPCQGHFIRTSPPVLGVGCELLVADFTVTTDDVPGLVADALRVCRWHEAIFCGLVGTVPDGADEPLVIEAAEPKAAALLRTFIGSG